MTILKGVIRKERFWPCDLYSDLAFGSRSFDWYLDMSSHSTSVVVLVLVLKLYLSTDFHVLVLVLETMHLSPCQRPFWVSYHLTTDERLSKIIFL